MQANAMALEIETWDLRRLTPERARAVAELLVQVWPKPHLTVDDRTDQMLAYGREFAGLAGPMPRSFVVREDGRVIAHAVVFPRTIRTADGEMTIAALARVCTEPKRRGQGLGEAVAREAFAAVDRGEFPFSLFQTTAQVRPFYERLGCVVVENPITNTLAEEPKANPFWDGVVMRYPSRGQWPAGTIDLRGPGY
jgi:predicted GNAT family N-acyltransferase